MADTLALPYLYDVVSTYMATLDDDVTHYFGWREPPRQLRAKRIVWVPGDPNGKLGNIVGGRKDTLLDGSTVVASLAELFYVEITSWDATTPTDEALQYAATRELFNRWWYAVYRKSRVNVTLQDAHWIVAQNEFRHGATIQAVCAILSPIPTPQATSAPVDTTVDATHIIGTTDDSPVQEIPTP